MRYVNPLVEGSSPSPVTEVKTPENPGFLEGIRGFFDGNGANALTLGRCTEIHEKEALPSENWSSDNGSRITGVCQGATHAESKIVGSDFVSGSAPRSGDVGLTDQSQWACYPPRPVLGEIRHGRRHSPRIAAFDFQEDKGRRRANGRPQETHRWKKWRSSE